MLEGLVGARVGPLSANRTARCRASRVPFGSAGPTARSSASRERTAALDATPIARIHELDIEDPGVITGGAGRFADASGTMTTSGLANLATG
jgi:hypothetical protein